MPTTSNPARWDWSQVSHVQLAWNEVLGAYGKMEGSPSPLIPQGFRAGLQGCPAGDFESGLSPLEHADRGSATTYLQESGGRSVGTCGCRSVHWDSSPGFLLV